MLHTFKPLILLFNGNAIGKFTLFKFHWSWILWALRTLFQDEWVILRAACVVQDRQLRHVVATDAALEIWIIVLHLIGIEAQEASRLLSHFIMFRRALWTCRFIMANLCYFIIRAGP